MYRVLGVLFVFALLCSTACSGTSQPSNSDSSLDDVHSLDQSVTDDIIEQNDLEFSDGSYDMIEDLTPLDYDVEDPFEDPFMDELLLFGPDSDPDQDGLLGDEDNCPFVHDPTDTQVCDLGEETEPNEYPEEATILDLPFAMRGKIGSPIEVEDPDWGEYALTADLDIFTFYAEAGKMYRFFVITDSDTDLIPVATVFMEDHFFQRTIGGDEDNHVIIDVFAPYDGEYYLAVTDVRNILDPPENVGGATGYGYSLFGSEIPLATLPLQVDGVRHQRSLAYLGQIEVFEVQLPADVLFTARTFGSALPNESSLATMPRLWGVNEDREVRYGMQMLGPDKSDARVWYKTPQAGNYLVVMDYRMAFIGGENHYELSLTLDDPELEQEENHGYGEAFPFSSPGRVAGDISEPKLAALFEETSLVQDMDYYYFWATAGSLHRLEFQADEGAALDPYLILSTSIVNEAGFHFGAWLENWDSNGSLNASCDILVPYTGYYYAILRETMNVDKQDNYLGGEGYGYELLASPLDFSATPITELPHQSAESIELAGSYDFFTLNASKGERLIIEVNAQDQSVFNPWLVLYADDRHTTLAMNYDIDEQNLDSRINHVFTEDLADVVLAVRDELGLKTDNAGYQLSIEQSQVVFLDETEPNDDQTSATHISDTSTIALGSLNSDSGDLQDYFTFDGLADQVVSIVLRGGEGLDILNPKIKLFKPDGSSLGVPNFQDGIHPSIKSKTIPYSGKFAVKVYGIDKHYAGSYSLEVVLGD